MGLPRMNDKGTGCKPGQRGLVSDFLTLSIDPLRMNNSIDLVDGSPLIKPIFGIAADPIGFETHGVLATAFKTGSVPRRERRDFVQKEKLGISVGRHDGPVSPFEFKYTGYPGLQSKRPLDGLPLIVQHTPIPHPGATRRRADDIPAGVHPVLQHIAIF